MLDYGRLLEKALAENHGAEFRFSLRAPDTSRSAAWLRRWKRGRGLAMYGSRYVLYPRLARRESADVYHILDHGNASLIRYLDPARTVVTCHDLIPLIFSREGTSLWPWLSRRMLQEAMSGIAKAGCVAADSSSTRRDLIERLGLRPDKIHVVPLGIDEELRPPSPEERKAARESFGFARDEAVLVHAGQNASYKNLEGLLSIFQLLAQRGQPVLLARAGVRFSAIQSRHAVKLGVEKRVRDLGPLPRERLRQLYHAADLLVYPSWYEGFGFPPLEAMACGLPAAVSNRGSLPEIVGDAALIADPADPAHFADAAEKILRDPALQAELRKKGFAQAAKFRWKETAARMGSIYRSLLA